MSLVITPPDIIIESPTFLIINAAIIDIEMMSQWLRISDKDYTIHLYHDGMSNPDWLKQVADKADKILIAKNQSNVKTLEHIFHLLPNVVWFGNDQEFHTIIDYLAHYGRT